MAEIRARVTFISEVFIEGSSMEEIRNKWEATQLHPEGSDIEFVEVDRFEDADTGEEITSLVYAK